MTKRQGVMLFAALVSGLWSVAAQPRQVMLDKVVAVVGGSSILYSEMDEYARQLTAQRRAEGYTSDRDPRNEALEALLTQKLLYNQALLDSLEINTADIAAHVDEQVAQMAEEAGGIARLERQRHMAIFNIREVMRRRYEEQAYAQSMQSSVIERVTVTPGEVERFYRRLDRDSLPIIPEQYVYAQITRFPASMVQARQRARERLLEMRERIITGNARFEDLARMYSQDAGTAYRGGEMGPARLNELDASFAAALEKLRPGQISEVTETQYGYHIIQLVERRGSLYRFRHILLRPTYTDEELVASMRTLDSLVRLVRADSLTFEKAALDYSDDPHSKMNGGLVSNHDVLEYYNAADVRLTQTAFFREDFGRFQKMDDYAALSRLEPGEISDAFLTRDMAGNDMAKVVKLVEVIPTHTASLDRDYLRLEEMALAAKRDRVFRSWLDDKIDAMYVFIAPEYRDGPFENRRWVKK